ncbi:MAG: hypothetical protein ACK5LS_03555 [Propioniciclava sp.]
MNELWTRRTLISTAAVAGATLPLLPTAAHAAPRRRRTTLAPFTATSYLDPYASHGRTTYSRYIKALAIDSAGRIFPGHGDWSGNVGPIDVHYLDPTTGEFSAGLMAMQTESTEAIRSLDGRIVIPNSDPRGFWGGGSPFAIQQDSGAFLPSQLSNTLHAYDVCRLEGSYGSQAYAVIGNYIDAGHGVASNAVYFTTDGGATFQVALYPADVLEDARQQVCFWVRGALYVTAKSSLWRWNGKIPESWSNWHDYFTEVIPGLLHVDHYQVGHSSASNGTVALMHARKGGRQGTYTYDGTVLRQVTSRYLPHLTATQAADGMLYLLGPRGLVRTRDGLRWQIHLGTGELTTTYYSVAVDSTTVWGGTADSRIEGFASAAGPWRGFRTKNYRS